MNYYSFEPEVACQLGDKSILNSSVHPPIVTKLHCVFDGWLGDDIIEVFPCYVITEKFKEGIIKYKLSGCSFEDVIVSKSDVFKELYPNRNLPNFFRLIVTGKKDVDDFVISNDNILLVSENAYSSLKRFNLENCDIESE
jgi:hypothetical protein